MNIKWLIQEFQKAGFTLVEHRAGQLSEFYKFMPHETFYVMIQWVNAFWFDHIKNPVLSSGNIIIFKKN